MKLSKKEKYILKGNRLLKESRRRFYEDEDEDEDEDDINYDVEMTDIDDGSTFGYDSPFENSIDGFEDWESQKTPEELEKMGYVLEQPDRDVWVKKNKRGATVRYWRGDKTGSTSHWQRDIDDEMNGDDGLFDTRNTGVDLDDENSTKIKNLRCANPFINQAGIKKWKDDWDVDYDPF